MTMDKKILNKKSAPTLIRASIIGASAVLASAAHAAPEVIVTPNNTGTTTIVEQTSDGQVATITATPNGISMKNGMPYAVTTVTNVPRYTVHQSSNNAVIDTGTTTVTTLPVNTIPVTKQVTSAGVITTPVSSVTQTPVTTLPVTTNNAVTVTSMDTLQINPVFSTPDVVAANTKVMKILKDSTGREVAVPANSINAGDIIEYHTVYTNTTARPVSDINATVNLPNNVKLVSLNSPLPTLATIGGNTYQHIGQVGTRSVIQEPYSGLKWNLVDLGANAAQTVVIRAAVE